MNYKKGGDFMWNRHCKRVIKERGKLCVKCKKTVCGQPGNERKIVKISTMVAVGLVMVASTKMGYIVCNGQNISGQQNEQVKDSKTGLKKVTGGHTGNKFGYVNKQGEEIIPPIYDNLSEPGDNGIIRAEYVATVEAFDSDNESYGGTTNTVTRFFYENGEQVYDYVRPFRGEKNSEITVVRENKEYFLVDSQGNRISEKSYDYIEDVDDYGNFIVRQGTKQGLLNSEGKEIMEPSEAIVVELYDEQDKTCGVYSMIGNEGSQIITDQGENPVTWQKGQIESVSLSRERYQINLSGGVTEIRDFSGNVVVSGEYGTVCLYSNGCISVEKDGEISAVLDSNGKEILSGENEDGNLKYIDCFEQENIGDGIQYTRENGAEIEKEGFFTLDGKISLPCVYDKISYMPDKQVIVYAKDEQIGVMNLKNEILWEIDASSFYTSPSTEVLFVYKNGKYGLAETDNGTMILDCEYDYIINDRREPKCWILEKNNKYGVWNEEDRKYKEIPYDEEYEVLNGLGEFLEISVDGIGIIDRNGNCILEPIYDEVYYDEKNEVFLIYQYVETDDEYIEMIGLTDKNGQFLVPLGEYEEISWDTNIIFVAEKNSATGDYYCMDYDGNEKFVTDGGLVSFLQDGYIGITQKGGDVIATTDEQNITELTFQEIHDSWYYFGDGIIGVYDGEDYQGNGYVGADGEEIIPCKYDSVDADHGFVIVSNESENGEKFSLVNMQGEILIDSQYDYMAFLDGDPNVLCVRKDGSDFYGLIDLNNEIIADLSEREENNEYIQINSMFISDGTISVSWSNGTEELFDYSGNKLAEYSSYVRYGE